MLPAILECEIFKVTEGPYGDDNRLIVECLICCFPKRVYQAKTNQTGNLHKHVKKSHPDLLYKVELKKIEQSNIRRKQRNVKKRIARSLRNKNKKEVELKE